MPSDALREDALGIYCMYPTSVRLLSHPQHVSRVYLNSKMEVAYLVGIPYAESNYALISLVQLASLTAKQPKPFGISKVRTHACSFNLNIISQPSSGIYAT